MKKGSGLWKRFSDYTVTIEGGMESDCLSESALVGAMIQLTDQNKVY